MIGIYLAGDNEPCFRVASGYQENPKFGDFAPGIMASFDADVPNQNQLNIAAVVEADCDADGFGDETQDPDTSACRTRTLSLDANRNKVRKGKKVALSGQITNGPLNASGCAANQTVELQRKRPS